MPRIEEEVLRWMNEDANKSTFDLCHDEPELAWEVILALSREQLTKVEIAILAAGNLSVD